MIKTMEYMALGKPIVAFDLLETRFSAQESALYAQPNLVEDFANNIEILLNSHELRCKLGHAGRERAVQALCWEETRKNLILAYKLLLPLP